MNHLSKGGLGIKFDKKCLRNANTETSVCLDKFCEISSKFNLSRKKLQKEKSKIGLRIPGSGRIAFGEQYPELSHIMLSLFDSSGDGLCAHPRLICDTLFLEKRTWLDMPRCVSVLNQVFDIPISLSAAYTYTDNYKSGSMQALRHHQGTNLNPGISLKKSTRDGQKHPSINSQYAVADVKYTVEGMFERDVAGIARDNKALVHTDIEVVQRSSKSWVRVQYEDHDWGKDSNRTLAITTYQFIKLKDLSPGMTEVNQLNSIPLCTTHLSGPGISLVKMPCFQKESIFRHLMKLCIQ